MTELNRVESSDARTTVTLIFKLEFVGVVLGFLLTLIVILWSPDFLGPYPGWMIGAGLFLVLCGAVATLHEKSQEGTSTVCVFAAGTMAGTGLANFIEALILL